LAALPGNRWRLVRVRGDALSSWMRRPFWGVRPPRWRGWLVVALVVAVSASLAWIVLGTSVLGVRRVDVTGSRIATADKVRAVAAVAQGTPLARVDTAAVATRVRTLPSVAEARVSRSWPSTLVITVTERAPVAVTAVNGAFVVLDAGGVAFGTLPARPDGLTLVRVPSPGPGDPTTLAALTVAAALPPSLRVHVAAVVAESPTRIRLEVAGGRVIIWGDAEHNDTKGQAAAALLPRPAKTIDVSAPDVVTTTG
jgi:cell division protein FtsQ